MASEWLYRDRPVTETDLANQYGFVYRITNLCSGRKYIGKKLLWFRRSIRTNNKRRRVELRESDWRAYWGSNKELLNDVARLGETSFRREILAFGKTKGELNYLEALLQFQYRVLELPHEYYNDLIHVRVSRRHILGTEKQHVRRAGISKEEKASGSS